MSFSIPVGMGTWQWLLDLVVAVLLAATLLRAYRLERALVALRDDRSALETLLGGFDVSSQQARSGIEAMRELADSAGRRVEHQSNTALALKDDLAAMIGRGERLAERLDHALRAMRAATPPVDPGATARTAAIPVAARAEAEAGRVRSKAERDLLMALQARG